MDNTARIRDLLSELWIPSIYAEKVKTRRTRSYLLDIAEKEHKPEILYTLLGFELKVGNQRFACPDLTTARYLLVFARMGCREFAVPYDITMISAITDEFETAWQHFLFTLENESGTGTPASSIRKTRTALLREMRKEIGEIGPGPVMPSFKQTTKQRSE